MAEQLLYKDTATDAWSDRPAQITVDSSVDVSGSERALRAITTIATDRGQVETGGQREKHPGGQRAAESLAMLELVREACESIRISEERVAALEIELEQVSVRSRDDLRNMSARLSASQDEIKAANARASASDARAADAEAWLEKINEALVDGFGLFVQKNRAVDQHKSRY